MCTLAWEDSNRKGEEEGKGGRQRDTGATEEKEESKEESVSEQAKLGTMNREREME